MSAFGTVNTALGGEQGIRTLDTGFSPYTRLAGERLRPTRPTLHDSAAASCLAEGVGFEPTEPFQAQRFSRPSPSTARTPLQFGT